MKKNGSLIMNLEASSGGYLFLVGQHGSDREDVLSGFYKVFFFSLNFILLSGTC